MTETPTASVVIPTYRRPESVRECLAHLARLRVRPLEVLVVDASPDDATGRVVREFPDVRYLRNDLGAGRTPESRALGVDAAHGDVVAFVDDDAYVDEEWLAHLLAPYADPAVVGVGGRIVNGIAGEERTHLDQVGRFLPDGRLLGNFTADTGQVIAVDHFLGANMSFRRQAILDVGGVHGGYPAPCVCEESDIALRQRALGRRLVFNPEAVVRHVSAPYAIRGDRFDRRWHYVAARNHTSMLVRIFGPGATCTRNFGSTTVRRLTRETRHAVGTLLREPSPTSARRSIGAAVRIPITLSGLVVGFVAGLALRRAEAPGRGDMAGELRPGPSSRAGTPFYGDVAGTEEDPA